MAGRSCVSMSFIDLQSSLKTMNSHHMVAARLPKLRKLERRFNEAGIWKIVSSVGRDVPADLAAKAIEYVWLQGVLDETLLENPRLYEFAGDAYNRYQDKFAKQDILII